MSLVSFWSPNICCCKYVTISRSNILNNESPHYNIYLEFHLSCETMIIWATFGSWFSKIKTNILINWSNVSFNHCSNSYHLLHNYNVYWSILTSSLNSLFLFPFWHAHISFTISIYHHINDHYNLENIIVKKTLIQIL
jgi:hypothetical protein